jgi:fucose permease
MASFYGFLVLGMSDSSTGVLLPYLEEYYHLDYLVVSITFLTPFMGYVISAILSEYIHRLLGRWGVAVLGTSMELVCYIICVCKPPFPLYVISYAICGFGNGIIDSSWNSWLGGLRNSNQVMGLLHGFYGAGGILGPAILTTLTGAGIEWNICYAVMIGFSVCSILFSCLAYWGDTPTKYRESVKSATNESSPIVEVTKSKVSLLIILSFIFCEELA